MPNIAWATDITYVRLPGGFVFLTAIMDLFSRRILSWRVSNTLDASFCADALSEALERHGAPFLFNTDQGAQFTSGEFRNILDRANVVISMDGKGRAFDNIWVERFWRTVKYEAIFPMAIESIKGLKAFLDGWIPFYNDRRYHQSLDYLTPSEVYFGRAISYKIRAA